MAATLGGSSAINKPLGRDDILSCDDVRIEKVIVPEWQGYVFVRGMSGRERDRFEEAVTRIDKKGVRAVRYENFRARLCAECICNEQGERLFSPQDIALLGKKNAAALARVFAKATELSGMSEDDVEEMVGNSDADPSDDSGSD